MSVGGVLSVIRAVPPKLKVYPLVLAEKLLIINAKVCPEVTFIPGMVGGWDAP